MVAYIETRVWNEFKASVDRSEGNQLTGGTVNILGLKIIAISRAFWVFFLASILE